MIFAVSLPPRAVVRTNGHQTQGWSIIFEPLKPPPPFVKGEASLAPKPRMPRTPEGAIWTYPILLDFPKAKTMNLKAAQMAKARAQSPATFLGQASSSLNLSHCRRGYPERTLIFTPSLDPWRSL